MSNEILLINKICKTYFNEEKETLAVKDFSLTVNDGEIIALVGPSGCGKSTILSILSSIEKQTSGSINKKKGLIIGCMFQNDLLFEWRNIFDNCLIGLEIQKNNSLIQKNQVINLLKKYGLKKYLKSKPSNLSGGMRQRVALIRTLAINPDLLLLDEPFSALDYQTRIIVSNDVYKIIKAEKKSAIIVTHDISEAISMADRVIVLSHRPAQIKKEFKITFKNNNDPINKRNTEEFNDYYQKIWKEIDYYAE